MTFSEYFGQKRENRPNKSLHKVMNLNIKNIAVYGMRKKGGRYRKIIKNRFQN